MTNKVFDGQFIKSLLNTKPDDVKVGCLGGRYVMVGNQSMTMNSIVKNFSEWSDQSINTTKKRQVLSKIRELDASHPENSICILFRVLTRFRQFIGNFCYNRHTELEAIEKTLPVPAKPSAPALKPSSPPSRPPMRAEDQPDSQPHFRPAMPFSNPLAQLLPNFWKPVEFQPQKPSAPDLPTVQRGPSAVELLVRKDPPKSYQERIQYYKDWDGAEPLPKVVIQDLYPMIAGTVPFCILPADRKTLIIKNKGAPVKSQSLKMPNILVPCLLDRILLLNGITNEHRCNEIKYAVYYGKNFLGITDYETFIRDLINSEISVRYIKDAFIYFTLQAMKSPILEACLEVFSSKSLNFILKCYSEHYTKNNLRVDVKDATLEQMIKRCVELILDKQAEDIEKGVIISSLSMAMSAHGTLELAWIGNEIQKLQSLEKVDDVVVKKYFTDSEILELLRTYKRYHQGLINNHDVYIALRSLLPLEMLDEEQKQLEKLLQRIEPARNLPPPRQWISRPKQTLERAVSVPVLPSPRAAESEPPLPKKPPELSSNQKKRIDSYKTDPPSLQNIQAIIPRELVFEQAGSKGETVQMTIRKITGQYEIDLNNGLTIQILGDIFGVCTNSGDVKKQIVMNWLKKMSFDSINKLIERYLQSIKVMHDGKPPATDETPKLILLELSRFQWKKGIRKELLISLVKIFVPRAENLNDWIGTILIEMHDRNLLDEKDKKELEELYKVSHPLGYPTLTGYKTLQGF